MKYLLINSVCGIGSTGRICAEIAQALENQGHEVRIAYGRSAGVPQNAARYAVRIGSGLHVRLHALASRLLDCHGFGSRLATKRFLRWVEEYDPDVLWLHNIHGYYINIELLFRWIKSRPQMQVKWTLHDCWAFTGHCTHFSYAKCDKWKTGCKDCPQKNQYPASLLMDRSEENYRRKKELFTGVKNMSLIVPSNWLAGLVKQSFLQSYPVEVRYNTVNTSVFKPTESDFRQRHGLENKFIVLGVASVWDRRKGLDDFIELSKRLDDRFRVVLVGLNKKQLAALPENVLGIGHTDSPEELAAIYTAADVFVNPSREESFGLTTLEAEECGTQTIVYKDTACEEVAGLYGGIVAESSVDALEAAIIAFERSIR